MNPEKTLPPLILHPFADANGPEKLVESSRASLMLQGLLPPGERSSEELDRALIEGRYCEIRMLFYVGKDLLRWIEQCLEHIERHEEMHNPGIKYQSFAAYLVNHTPAAVQTKLRKWGVADYKAIFTRALGLNAILAGIPRRELLSEHFIRNYYHYADQMFSCRQNEAQFEDISEMAFEFEIYASGEYSRILEREWAES
ncbi:MAG TPA: hypothetical protein VMB85_24030 [Bryobacteraceae bacterium]|jgi:hypothetical protein|nr:hypothetical protein [Bryobacteraceae bacterium]